MDKIHHYGFTVKNNHLYLLIDDDLQNQRIQEGDCFKAGVLFSDTFSLTALERAQQTSFSGENLAIKVSFDNVNEMKH